MKTRSFKNIVAFEAPTGKVIGFHMRNLEVAELSTEAWESLSSSPLPDLEDWAQSTSPSASSDSRFDYINSVNINVSQVCNLKCLYCEAGGDGSYGRPEKKIAIDKAIPALSKMLARVPNGGEFTVTFVGGEPLLYPEGMKILADYCQQQLLGRGVQLNFRVITNGTLFTDAIIELLKEYKMHVVVSLDGPPEMQDRIRPTAGGKGSSERVAHGLNLLRPHAAQLGSVLLRAIFGTHNTDVQSVFEYFRQWEFASYEFNYDVANSSPEISEQFTQNLIKTARAADREQGELGLRQLKFFDRVFDRLDRQIRVENFCDSGKSFAVIDGKGKIFKCPWETNQDQNAVGEADQFELKTLQDIEMSLIDHNNCTQCWARHLCGGGCMYAHGLATGAKSSPDRVYCKRTRNLISEAILMYLERREVAQ